MSKACCGLFTAGIIHHSHKRHKDVELEALTRAINSFIAWADEDFEGLREVQKLSVEDLQLRLKEYGKLDAALLGAAGDDRLQLLHLVYKQCFEQPWVKEIRFGTSDVAPVLSSRSRSSLQKAQNRLRYNKWLQSLFRTDRFERLWMELEANASKHCADPSLLEAKRLQMSYLPRRDLLTTVWCR